MRRIAAIVASTVALSGCAVANFQSAAAQLEASSLQRLEFLAYQTQQQLNKGISEADVVESAKVVVANKLKDPESVRFRNVRLVKFMNEHVVCGEVNGKNSYGGYVGFSRFMASPIGAELEDTDRRYPHITMLSNAGLNRAC